MEWQVRYKPADKAAPWSLYKVVEERDFFAARFRTREEAEKCAERRRAESVDHLGKIDEASAESFPASDPPAWTRTTTGAAGPERKS